MLSNKFQSKNKDSTQFLRDKGDLEKIVFIIRYSNVTVFKIKSIKKINNEQSPKKIKIQLLLKECVTL